MIKDFREFLLRGTVADLAVAIVMGFAFNSLVSALVSDFITPSVVAITGEKDFTVWSFTSTAAPSRTATS